MYYRLVTYQFSVNVVQIVTYQFCIDVVQIGKWSACVGHIGNHDL